MWNDNMYLDIMSLVT